MDNDNKLIAEFMGYRECPMKLYRMNDEFEDITIYSTFQDEDEYLTIESGKIQIKFSPNQMRFHESWDWLMPVVAKIENYLADNMGRVGYFDDCNDLEARYQSVVEFIKFYNTKKEG